ncbi:MAG: two-component sensor histidine kinase [Deltaproteobacteria bacterium]|nr:two-component sensor histidine kinase [Deltaproteobacteria bacterium]
MRSIEPPHQNGDQEPRPEEQRPFELVRYYSVTSLVIILLFTLLISTLVSMRANDLVLKNQVQFAKLLAENLNHQVMVRFVVPALKDYGRINVGQPEQFGLLDAVVKNTIHSFKVQKVNILDLDGNIIYSTQNDYISRVGNEGVPFQVAVAGGVHSQLEPSLGMFIMSGESTRVLKTFVPLRDERRRTAELGAPRAVFEIVMDVSHDFQEVWLNQVLIVGALLCMMALLFIILRSIVLRGQRVMAHQAEERVKLEEQLNQAQRLASLGRMVAGVAHEIRNPLGIVRSTAELLGSRIDPTLKPLSEVIVEESNRLNRIVTEFLDFARPQLARLEPILVEQVLERNLLAFAPEAARAGVRVVKAFSRAPVRILGDADLLYRVFLNILNNALQALEDRPEGLIQVSTNDFWQAGQRFVRVEVEDNGPGISPEKASQIFDPFFTTKETGTGLGLSIVSNIVASHGGKVVVGRSPLGGAKVELRLSAA